MCKDGMGATVADMMPQRCAFFDGIMDDNPYCNILQTTLNPFIREKLRDHRFIHDDDPK